MRKLICLAGALLLLLAVPLSAGAETEDVKPYIQRMIRYYQYYQERAQEENDILLDQIRASDPALGTVWELIMDSWSWANSEMEVNEGVLPDGLPEDDSLCIVVLGFGLGSNGSMKPELIDRLQVALASAEKYPNAYVLCTGGETAYDTPGVSEAEQMGAWLASNGISESRLILEDRSLSTAENAIYTHDLLIRYYPRVSSIAIVTSDYHIRWGFAMFTTVSHYTAYQGSKSLKVAGNAVCRTETPDLDTMDSQALGISLITGVGLGEETVPPLEPTVETAAPVSAAAEETEPVVVEEEPESREPNNFWLPALLAAAVLAGLIKMADTDTDS